MLEGLDFLQGKKNLLAFSHGVDSSALFHLLKEAKIEFDLAFINYKTRINSDVEEKSARQLAKANNKKIFIKIAPKISKNFEKIARDVRYDFFAQIMQKGYENLVFAHQMNDNFEWMLMQLAKGCGLAEMLGMDIKTNWKGYFIIRPLINASRNDILSYLEANNIKYFIDSSNLTRKYARNRLRLDFANDFVSQNASGIKNSFKYLRKDLASLGKSELKHFKGLIISDKVESCMARGVKALGVLLSAKQRLVAMQGDCVLSGKVGVCHFKDKFIIFPYTLVEKIPKDKKENYRLAKIPRLLRGYLYAKDIKIKQLLALL